MTSSTSAAMDYARASREELLARIAELERATASTSKAPSITDGVKPAKLRKQARKIAANPALQSQAENGEFFDRYPSRKIALRFSYEGWLYGGLALQSEDTPLPTVEGVLLDALVQARLIRSKDDIEAIDFSRCGRTDRGVSAAGQVVALYVRSQLRDQEGQLEKGWRPAKSPKPQEDVDSLLENPQLFADERNKLLAKKQAREKVKDELPYMNLMNRALPPSIRVLAWSPVDHDFDARFSCSSRHYKYFFVSPAAGSGASSVAARQALDIDAMRDAASRLVGEHDFRNLCKVDATKQITNFNRRVISAIIDPVTPDTDGQADQLFVLNLKGSAFLYHQVRHIMAILFLVGSGQEQPEIINALTHTGYAPDGEMFEAKPGLPLVPSKPSYEMADDLPLVLWDCHFPPESLSWRQDPGIDRACQDIYAHYVGHRIRATISEHFWQAFESFRDASLAQNGEPPRVVQLGAGRTLNSGKYMALLDRPRSERVEKINERWLQGQGKRRAERKAASRTFDVSE